MQPVRIYMHFNSDDKSFINIEHDRDLTHTSLKPHLDIGPVRLYVALTQYV